MNTRTFAGLNVLTGALSMYAGSIATTPWLAALCFMLAGANVLVVVLWATGACR